MQDAYDDLRSSTSASPEPCKLLGQRKSDRYNEVLRDAIIDPRDHDFARPEQTAGLNIVNPYQALRGSSVSNDVTFQELNAHCPSANRPSFHAEGEKLDKLPNTNGLHPCLTKKTSEKTSEKPRFLKPLFFIFSCFFTFEKK